MSQHSFEQSFMGRHGLVHRSWLRWVDDPNLTNIRWPWRWLCWLDGEHQKWAAARGSSLYCVVCFKPLVKG